MGTARQFAKNSFWLAASAVAVILIGAVYRPIIARIVGPVDYGRYNFIVVYVSYFTVLAYLGVRQVIVREIGREKNAAGVYLHAAWKLRAFTIVIAFITCSLSGYILCRGHIVTTGIVIMTASMAITGISDLLEGVLVGLGRSAGIAVSTFVGNALKLALGIWALRAGFGVLGVLWVFVLSSIVSTAISARFTRNALQGEAQDSGAIADIRFIFRESLPFALMAMSSRLYHKSDVLVLSLMKGDKVTGLYSAAYIFLDLMIAAGISVTTTAYPLVTKLYTDGGENNNTLHAYERLHKHALLLLLPVSALLMFFAVEILTFVFEDRYLGGVPAMKVLVWTAALVMSGNISGTFLSAIYRQSLNAVLSIVGMVIHVILTVVLIVLYGSIGAAVAAISASAINAVIHAYYVNRTIGSINLMDIWIKPIICCAVMTIMLYELSSMMWVWRLLLALLAFAGAILVVKPYDKEDKRLLISIVGR